MLVKPIRSAPFASKSFKQIAGPDNLEIDVLREPAAGPVGERLEQILGGVGQTAQWTGG